jgi:hypothetical protein
LSVVDRYFDWIKPRISKTKYTENFYSVGSDLHPPSLGPISFFFPFCRKEEDDSPTASAKGKAKGGFE